MDELRRDGEGLRFFWPIDVARFLFAFLVVCGHTYGFARLTRSDWTVDFFERVQPGGLWVSGFFVMSGWCIAGGQVGRDRFDFSRYVAARLSRILPLYVVFLVAAMIAEGVFVWTGGRTAEIWDPWAGALVAQWTMTQGFFGPFGAYNPSWSLTHEIVCYLVWGLLMSGTERRWRASAMLAVAFLPVVLASLAHVMLHTRMSWLALSLPLYFFVWLLGAAAAETPVAWIRRRSPHLALVALLFAVPLVAYAVDRRVPETIGMIAFSVLLALAATQMHRVRGGPRVDRVAHLLGLASYPLYLGHGIVVVAASVVVAQTGVSLEPGTFLAVAVALSVAASVLVGVPLERRFMAWRSDWLRRRFGRRVAPRGLDDGDRHRRASGARSPVVLG